MRPDVRLAQPASRSPNSKRPLAATRRQKSSRVPKPRKTNALKGVLITGSAKRIGAAVATRLATSGWYVVIHFSRSKSEANDLLRSITGGGGSASLVEADLSDHEARSRCMTEAFALCPGLVALVNNASLFEYDTFGTLTEEALTRAMVVNAIAPVHLAQSFVAALPGEADGCIVNVLDNKIYGLNPDYFSYTMSKYALFGATHMMARALAPRVRVCGIAPGITLVSGKQSEANFEAGQKMNPLRRGCTPEQVARAAEFILTSPSLNDQVITIDGGESLAPHDRDVAFLSDL